MPSADPKKLAAPARLAALRATGLLDAPPHEAFERLTQAASRAVGAPVALVSLIDDHRQFFQAGVGLDEPWRSARETPLSHSFCQHVVATGKPLVIADARSAALVADNLAIPDMGVLAYAGMPLTGAGGETIGSFCAVDTRPREWTPAELEILDVLAQAAIREVELRAAAVELERLGRFKSQMVRFAGHELRSPLAGIIGALDIIEMELPTDADRSMLELAQDSGHRLLRLINDLLDAEHLESGAIPVAPRHQELDRLVAAAADGVRATAQGHGIGLRTEPTGLAVIADADRIVQVLGNLLGNALKFSPAGSDVTVSAEPAEEGMVRVSVRDRGRGVPDAHKERIFEQFTQVEPGDKHEKGGSGLGLAICRAIVGLHGGTIRVEDAPGGGSVFSFTLPAG